MAERGSESPDVYNIRPHKERAAEAALMAFLMSTYEAAANLDQWDPAALEYPIGRPGAPRAVD